ncbi:4-alpha-glucanotransferase [Actinomyces sp. HPA0247]|uniref:4-alpha-glucanotransferase n=1 Tax=Actinomyces sp. HPA0247 TaxID=1203556 RepID=UPI00034E5F6E|nr:4-alpha-glucanotransferase [Actinomyces sp. HPA0247]EPD72716.1 4-alpha-glucanotransferase [Actinomyces sp. HPA0247]
MDIHAPASDNIDELRRIADANGVATGFWDWYGNWVGVSASTLLKVLGALGLPLDESSTVGDVHEALRITDEREWRRTLPPTIVARQGGGYLFPVHVPDGSWVNVQWVLEDGRKGACDQVDRYVPPRMIDGELVGRATFDVPHWLPLGWHRLVATVEGGHVESATLIIVPNTLSLPLLESSRRVWGVNAQLYSTRSASSWGIGDAADLADLAAICADKGADFLLINPVHASQPVSPLETSPYLPVSRRWLNPIYIRPENIEEFASLSQASREAIVQLRDGTRQFDSREDLIDRDCSWEAKRKALELIFAAPRSYHRQSQLDHFIERGGSELSNYALWCALVEREGTIELPEDLARSSAPRVEMERLELADRVDFYQWCQWVAAEQLEHAQHVAREVGMEIGIMADLAVGVHGYGSEKWSRPELFANGMCVGAPPDVYSQQGQNWSQPPWSPRSLAESGYLPLRDMVRAALANAGAVRIDHILGMFRLWWIPDGCSATEGTYVYYDHEAMMGVILLEAQRAGAVVIGEDLGVVEPWVRDYLRERGVLGTSVVWFEKEGGGWPLRPEHYRDRALAAVNIHDLPPTLGYIRGIQTTLRSELGLLTDDIETVRAGDRLELEQMNARLLEYGCVDGAQPSERETVEGLYRYVAQTPSKLVVASLVDAVGDVRPQNMPGTGADLYPNWCVPLCDSNGDEVPIEELPTDERLTSLFALLRGSVN